MNAWCVYCHKPISDTATRCASCGKPLTDKAMVIKCASCGKMVIKGAGKCKFCGEDPTEEYEDYDDDDFDQKAGLGIAALVLSIVGFLTGFIGIGIIFDIIAIILVLIAIISKKQKSGLGVAGLVLGAVAIILNLFVFSAIDSALGGNDKSSSDSTSKTEMVAQSATKSESPLDDDIIDVDINDCHVKYLRHELVGNMAGEKCVAVYYEFTNNSNESKAFYVTVSDKAFQGGIELDSSFFHVNDESHDTSAEIKPGVSITVCSAFELRDQSTDIELEVEPWINLKDAPSDKMILSIK